MPRERHPETHLTGGTHHAQPDENPAPLAAGLVLGTWFAKRLVPPQARTLCPPAGQAGIRRQMEQLKREYEKQDRMRRDFTANVSHELKTPLTSISGYAEIIREGMVKSEDVGRFAGKIYEEAQRLITLVEDILNLSHLDEGAPGQERRQGIDLYALCERAVASLAEAARQRGLPSPDREPPAGGRRGKAPGGDYF
ncbi:MAG: sensor histidine kinase [Evtepia gabavorous]